MSVIPVPPAGIALVMRRASDPEVSFAQLSRCIEHEPALATEVLRLANSSAYSSGAEITTAHQAVVVLGARVIRNMAVTCAVRAAMRDIHAPGFNMNRFWEDSLRRAVLAKRIALKRGTVDPADAFTVGLIQDVGTLLLAVQNPRRARQLDEATRLTSDLRIVREEEIAGQGHPEAFGEAAAAWQLPDDLVAAVRFHHAPTTVRPDGRLRHLVEVCHAADVVADVVQADPINGPLLRANELLDGTYAQHGFSIEALVGSAAETMESLADDFGFRVERQPKFTEVVVRSNRLLLKMTGQYEQLVQEKERILAHQRRLHEEANALRKELEAANERLGRLASTDGLTGLLRRRAFVEAAREAVRRTDRSVALVLLDLDHFKNINDTHGHLAGDAVLQEIARRLRASASPDASIGRIGGEEIGILVSDESLSDARTLAERVRASVGSRPIWYDGVSIGVTVSVGAIYRPVGQTASFDELFAHADDALYRSKHAGRDRVTWVPVGRLGQNESPSKASRVTFNQERVLGV
jgi:diguanylate cyclase (GGDEF)-like protein